MYYNSVQENHLLSRLSAMALIRVMGVHPPKSMMHLAYSLPLFPPKYKFPPYLRKIYKMPPMFVQFTFFGLIYVSFGSPILTTMHLCAKWRFINFR